MKLENWGIVSNPLNVFLPPELQSSHLVGTVDNHPVLGENKEMTSSKIVDVNGNKVTTHSGSVYELGTPHPDYIEYCKKSGVHVPTPEEPIKLA